MIWEIIGNIALCVAFIVVIILIVVLARRNMNHNYTVGSGMFKMSDDNLEKDEHMDTADYNYYNDDGIFK